MTDSRLTFSHEDGDLKISFESQGVTTDEVMMHFVQFLLGMGYERASIHEAMQEIVDEHEDYLKNYEKMKLDFPPELD